MAKKRAAKTTQAEPETPATDQAPAPVQAQSEIGPTTYGEGGVLTHHGPNDPETKAAYAAGHPSEGIVKPSDGSIGTANAAAATPAPTPAKPSR